MNKAQLLNIKVLPHEVTESISDQLGIAESHLSYKVEKRLMTCVAQGDIQKLFEELQVFSNSIGVGEMSADNLNQYKYMAVSSITLATRYAIEGGLNEADAYSFSDMFIRKIDLMKSPDKIISSLAQAIIELTNSVAEEKSRLKYSPHIRKCIAYINKNINKKITIKDISEQCGLSADYLSHLFKNEIGENLSSYILKNKLELSKSLLLEGLDNHKICQTLGFSSQSHFISVFKKQYGITPKQFVLFTK